jgi:hypothetical protein
VRNLIIPISVGLLCTSFTIIPKEKTTGPAPLARAVVAEPVSLYYTADLSVNGLSKEAFDYAWKGYENLLQQNRITKSQYLTICDFSQSSAKKRLYIIDISNKKLLINTYVAHGRNSGYDFATQFSNIPESLQSSLGFYVTADTYVGSHGLSLRVKGLEPGFNDKAYERTIVIHGAAYVDEARARAGIFMGRSYGCPAVPQKESSIIINTIKNGSCLFIYHPSANYLKHSKILNG